MRTLNPFAARARVRLDDIAFAACLGALAVSLAVLTAATTFGDALPAMSAADVASPAPAVAIESPAQPTAFGVGPQPQVAPASST